MAGPVFYMKRIIRGVCRPLLKRQSPRPPEVEHISVSIPGLPATFEGYTLAVVSDLHLPDNLCSPADIIQTLTEIKPDCILLPGDMANRYADFDEQGMTELFSRLTEIAPCYAITGNHERRPPHRDPYCALMKETGVIFLEDRWDLLTKNGKTLSIYGACFSESVPPKAEFSPSILLIHHPERAVQMRDRGFSLAVCGHAHGGQLRFGRQGLYAPGQGFFPRYTSGLYSLDGMQMVVSRGLGDSSITLRLNNPPHLPIIRLKCAPTKE